MTYFFTHGNAENNSLIGFWTEEHELEPELEKGRQNAFENLMKL